MPQEGTLLSIAQIALTLTGFAALVSVFRSGQQKWSQPEILGQYIILELSLAATFFAVLPVGLYYSVGSEHNIWRVSSAISLLFSFSWLLLTLSRGVQCYRKTRQFPWNPIITIFLTSFSLIMVGALAINMIWLDVFYIHLWNVLWMMLIGGTQFIFFVYEYARPGSTVQMD